jgi:thioredoxin 1
MLFLIIVIESSPKKWKRGEMSPVFDTPITTNDLSLDRLLAVRMPILLFFFNTPLQNGLEQQLKKTAGEFAGQLLVAKISKKENPEAARRYQISNTPAAIGFKDGQMISKTEGISAPALHEYALYLTGKGPKPVQETGPSKNPESYRTPPNGQDPSRRAGPSAPQAVTDYNFDKEVMQSSIPVLVDFWAPWCGPCRMTEPILNKLAQEMQGRLLVAKVNVDENPKLAGRFGIQSIPTMMVVKDGNIIDRWMGALPEPALRSRISRFTV